ncbi:MAG: CAP domain-containing protein [Pseudomonadota bacterium]
MPRIFFMFLVVALAACQTGDDGTRLPVSTSAGIAFAGTLLGSERANAGVSPVTQHPALQAAAQFHADDLAARSGLSHTGSDGSSMADRIRRAGYQPCFAAENVARGQPDIESVFASWRGSQGHYNNMVNVAARHYGFARSGNSWVLVLARPCL